MEPNCEAAIQRVLAIHVDTLTSSCDELVSTFNLDQKFNLLPGNEIPRNNSNKLGMSANMNPVMDSDVITSDNFLKATNMSGDTSNSILSSEVACSQIEPVISCDNKCDSTNYYKNNIYNEDILVSRGNNFKKNYIIESSIYESKTLKTNFKEENQTIPEPSSKETLYKTSEGNSCNEMPDDEKSVNKNHVAEVNNKNNMELFTPELNSLPGVSCNSENNTTSKTTSISKQMTDVSVSKPNNNDRRKKRLQLVSGTQKNRSDALKNVDKGKKTFRCTECPWAFSSNIALQSHIGKSHQKKSSTIYTEGFSKRRERLRKKSKKAFQCPICKCSFRKAIEMRAHIVAHSKEILQCKFCGLTFAIYKDLKSHLLTHKRKPATCEVCGKTFTQAGNMKTHLRTHTKEKPYTCERCGKQYAQSGDLTVHMRMHVEEKPFLCEVCGNLFYSLSHLSRHSKVHTREKPYTCQVCEKSFAHSHHLKKHYRIHTQEKPYMCEICGKAFSRADYLKQHIRVHTKEKPYICVICGKGFSQGGSLRLHQRVHTRQGISNTYSYTHDVEIPML